MFVYFCCYRLFNRVFLSLFRRIQRCQFLGKSCSWLDSLNTTSARNTQSSSTCNCAEFLAPPQVNEEETIIIMYSKTCCDVFKLNFFGNEMHAIVWFILWISSWSMEFVVIFFIVMKYLRKNIYTVECSVCSRLCIIWIVFFINSCYLFVHWNLDCFKATTVEIESKIINLLMYKVQYIYWIHHSILIMFFF